jgi:beta-lactam-binding protein with PASTA domain
VEDLTGFTEEDLNEFARSSGFDIRIVGEAASDTVKEGNVLSQNPAPDEKLEAGSTIEVTLSSGPAALPQKTYIKTIEIPYEPEEPAEEGEKPAPQKVQIYIQDKTRTMAEPADEFDITKTESRQLEMEIAEGESAVYRVVRDSTVILEETIDYDSVE